MERSTAQSIYGGAATEVTAPPWDITHPGEPAQLDGIGQNAKAEDFRMKNKAYEIIRYGNIALKDFPRYERYTLAADIRQSMYAILRLVIMLENKHYKKTTLGELDTEVDVLRHLIRLAADGRRSRMSWIGYGRVCYAPDVYDDSAKDIPSSKKAVLACGVRCVVDRPHTILESL